MEQKLMYLLIGVLLLHTEGYSQILKPVKWSYASKVINKESAIVYLKADIEDGWHIYSINQPDGGPTKTSFILIRSSSYALFGKTSEPQPIKRFEKAFGINVFYFEHSVIFQQKIKLLKKPTLIKGKLTYMVCNDHQCLPPEDMDFEIPIN